ncbi:uncharacterized protein Dwil_GK14323 [Drosophila willistoni]|uniref:CHK kinase-like domain-containing protein n=1 Tax=Drosophila willistoni TaxID=7260 RepID=B4NIJ8_DROWI|nr:uncharacterized protein Dwil_GK14323 [Drosophila willistoni]
MSTTTLAEFDWINEELFEGLIKKRYSNFHSIEQFIIDWAVGWRENFGSFVFRIEIEIQMKDKKKEKASYILKIPFESDRGDEHELHDHFVSESDMYDRLVPELESIYAKNTSLFVKFKPQHFKFTDSEIMPKCDYLLMEDLVAKGYKNMDRTVGLDQRQMEAVLKKLAQWHAASAVRVNQIGHYEEKYQSKVIDSIDFTIQSRLGNFLECMQQAYELEPEKQTLVKKYVSRLHDLFMDVGRIKPDEFNVLNHGDFWCNNFMFKVEVESNEILDVCFVDFQLPIYGTPAQDLLCLLMTSPQLGIKLSKFDYFVEFYHQELTKHLVLLHYNLIAPTLQQLQENLFRNSVLGSYEVEVYF